MKLLLFIPVWKRPDVFLITAERLKVPDWVDMKVVCMLSKEDPHYKENQRICREYRFNQICCENFPVGRKMNYGIKRVMRYSWDYLMGLNSDNIIADGYWDQVKKHIGSPMIGMNQIIAYDLPSGNGIKLKLDTHDVCKVWGGGRLLSYEAIDTTLNKLGYLYQDDLNSGLDTSSQRNIFENAMFDTEPAIIDGCYLMDIKTETNINPYNTLGNVPHTTATTKEMMVFFNGVGVFRN